MAEETMLETCERRAANLFWTAKKLNDSAYENDLEALAEDLNGVMIWLSRMQDDWTKLRTAQRPTAPVRLSRFITPF
jgi:predicted chitinase